MEWGRNIIQGNTVTRVLQRILYQKHIMESFWKCYEKSKTAKNFFFFLCRGFRSFARTPYCSGICSRPRSVPPRLLRPPPLLDFFQPPLQGLDPLLQATGLVSHTGAPERADTQQHADEQERGQPGGPILRVQALVAKDEDEAGQRRAHFQQPQGSPQGGGNQVVGEGEQPVANESQEDPLGDKDHTLRRHFVDGKANCETPETHREPERRQREV